MQLPHYFAIESGLCSFLIYENKGDNSIYPVLNFSAIEIQINLEKRTNTVTTFIKKPDSAWLHKVKFFLTGKDLIISKESIIHSVPILNIENPLVLPTNIYSFQIY